MYSLLKTAKDLNGNIMPENEQTVCVSHLQLISYALNFASRTFKAKNMKANSKYGQLLYLKQDEPILLGEIDNYGLYDKNGTMVLPLGHLQRHGFLMERYVYNRKTGESTFSAMHKTSGEGTSNTNGTRLLSNGIAHMGGLLNTNLPYHEKVGYFYDGEKLLYIVKREGLYDSDKKMLVNFSQFAVPKTPIKRLRSDKDKLFNRLNLPRNDNRI